MGGSMQDSETSSLRMAAKERGAKMSATNTEDSRSLVGAAIDIEGKANEKI